MYVALVSNSLLDGLWRLLDAKLRSLPVVKDIANGMMETDARVSLLGKVSEKLLKDLTKQLENIPVTIHPVMIEMTTEGGDAEIGRRMALEIDLARDRFKKDNCDSWVRLTSIPQA